MIVAVRALVQCQRSLGNYCYCNCKLIHFGVETTSTTVRAHTSEKIRPTNMVEIAVAGRLSFGITTVLSYCRSAWPLWYVHICIRARCSAQSSHPRVSFGQTRCAVCMSPFDIVSMPGSVDTNTHIMSSCAWSARGAKTAHTVYSYARPYYRRFV